MLSAAYTVAQWLEVITAGLTAIALIAIIMRLRKQPRDRILGATMALVVSAAVCAGSYVFLGTRVVQVKLDSIKEVGLELRHAGLRSDALRYNTVVSIPVTYKLLPSGFPGSGVVNDVSRYLAHTTTTVHAQVAVYSLIDFTTVDSRVATVDRQTRTITLSLPDPTIGKNTTYIAAVNGVQQQEGPLTAAVHGAIGLIDSLVHRPVVSVNPGPELDKAESVALAAAQRSRDLATCGKQDMARQLAGIFHLTPAYRGYALRVIWPTPPDAGVNCAALQAQLARSGS